MSKQQSPNAPRVLIVEDDPLLRALIVRSLSPDGYLIDEAENGSDGFKRALASPPDVVVTDLSMPVMSGTEMIRAMRDSMTLQTVPVVLLTAHTGDDTRLHVREAGADDFLTKPFDPWELRALVRNTIALKSKERSMMREMEEARKIQRSLLPQELPRPEGINVIAAYEPAAHVGGDYYDVLSLPDKSLALLVADVSGHGLSAAMIASSMQIIVSFSMGDAVGEPAQMLRRLNSILYGKTAGKFATIACGSVSADRRTLVFSLAGHPEPILWRSGRATSIKASHHLPIGVRPHVEYQPCRADLVPKDRVFFYSDAFTEALDSTQAIFGEARLLALIAATASLPLDQQLKAMIEGVRSFEYSRIIRDDATIVAFEVL